MRQSVRTEDLCTVQVHLSVNAGTRVCRQQCVMVQSSQTTAYMSLLCPRSHCWMGRWMFNDTNTLVLAHKEAPWCSL